MSKTLKSRQLLYEIINNKFYLENYKEIEKIVNKVDIKPINIKTMNFEQEELNVPVDIFNFILNNKMQGLLPQFDGNCKVLKQIKYIDVYTFKNLKVFYLKKNTQKIPEIFLEIITYFYQVKPSLNIDIYIFDYDLPRRISKTEFEFDSHSGLTYFPTPDHAKVLVSRSEEITRLLIHELIHAYDIIKIYNNHIENQYIQKLKVKDNFFEARTEALAIILNVQFYKKDIYKNLINEIIFSLYQSSKIIEMERKNFNVQYYSYIIVRTLLLLHLEEFLNDPNNYIPPLPEQDKLFDKIINQYMTLKKGDYMGFNLLDYR